MAVPTPWHYLQAVPALLIFNGGKVAASYKKQERRHSLRSGELSGGRLVKR